MGTKRTPPWPDYEEWSTARWWTFLRSGLRTLSRKWPPIYDRLEQAKRKSESTNKRLKWEYQCAECEDWFPQKQVCVDHILPAGSLKNYDDVVPFIQRLFCSIDNLQVLCDKCHNFKTNEEKNGKEIN